MADTSTKEQPSSTARWAPVDTAHTQGLRVRMVMMMMMMMMVVVVMIMRRRRGGGGGRHLHEGTAELHRQARTCPHGTHTGLESYQDDDDGGGGDDDGGGNEEKEGEGRGR